MGVKSDTKIVLTEEETLETDLALLRTQVWESRRGNNEGAERIREIREKIQRQYLAMGVPEESISKAAKMAICKVNIDTDLRLAITAKIREVCAEKPDVFDPRKFLGSGREAIKIMVKHKLHVLGCTGKAAECA